MPEPLTFPDATPRHGLPFLIAGQAQKEMHINEALARLDLLVHASVVGEAAEPPPAPQPGQCWLVATGAVGAWNGADGQLAGWAGEAWQFVDPIPGMAVWNGATNSRLFYNGGWHAPLSPVEPTGGATVDSEARVALTALVAALLEAGLLTPS